MSVIPTNRVLLQDGAFTGWTVVARHDHDHEFTVYSTGAPRGGLHILDADVDKLWMEVGAIETYGSDGKTIPDRWDASVFNGRTAWLNLAKVRREQPEHAGGRVPMPDPYVNKPHGDRQAATRVRSGEVNSDDSLVAFLYVLMRDHLTPGLVEEIILNHVAVGGPTPWSPERQFTNGWLASYAKDVAERLRPPVDSFLPHSGEACPHVRAGDCPFHRDLPKRCSVHGLTFMGEDGLCHWGTGGWSTARCPRDLVPDESDALTRKVP